jgi:hypothetical protein
MKRGSKGELESKNKRAKIVEYKGGNRKKEFEREKIKKRARI